jgi:hypothetical protein
MPKVAVYNMQGNTVGELELNDEIFAAPVNESSDASGCSHVSCESAAGHRSYQDQSCGQRRWS